MAEVQVRVCDVCKSVTLPAGTYTITQGETEVQVDLCDEHAQPIQELFALVRGGHAKSDKPTAGRTNLDGKAPKAAARKVLSSQRQQADKKPAPRSTSRSRLRVTSLEEIEKLKKAK